jgi:SAM-dependent methyltransferase
MTPRWTYRRKKTLNTSRRQRKGRGGKKPTIEEQFQTLYREKEGFGVSHPHVSSKYYFKTYGEIKPESVRLFYPFFRKDDVFYDLGCGTGKVVLQVAYEKDIKSIGVELNKERLEIARSVSDEMGMSDKVQFIEGDISKMSYEGGTVFYLCSTCFDDELMQLLWENLSKVQSIRYIFTLRPFPSKREIQKITVPTSWSDSSICYVYQVFPTMST